VELAVPPLSDEGPAPEAEGVLRYRSWIPVERLVTLGEPTTPLVELAIAGRGVLAKHEGAQPTGSFKDRGSAALVGWLAAAGAEEVIEDSSGNAGASIAAYCARAGIRCTIYVPEATAPAKLVQIRAVGARLVRVPGSRASTRAAAERAADGGAVYASHLWNPVFQLGTRTFAFELWEQLGRRAPDHVVLPLGAGSLLLGTFGGFVALKEAGLVDRIPRITGVQSSSCAPLARAFQSGAQEPIPVVATDTAAEGVKVERPPRGRDILRAVRESRGQILEIGESELRRALATLARTGILTEPTSALALAGAVRMIDRGAIGAGDAVVVALTGNGLKAPNALLNVLELQRER
jgi:threonine synthase